MSANTISTPGSTPEYFVIDGVPVIVTHSDISGWSALGYTVSGVRDYDLRAGFSAAVRISKEEFLVRLRHVESASIRTDAASQNLPHRDSPPAPADNVIDFANRAMLKNGGRR